MRALLPILCVVGCATSSPCAEDEVRVDGACVAYQPDDPVEAEVTAPAAGDTWQWQLTEAIDTSIDVDAYDIDLFDATDADLAALAGAGRVVICYFSAGSWEEWRDDADAFPEAAIGRRLDGWPDERWLDHTHSAVRDAMAGRLDLAAERGCDGVEPDNVTAQNNQTGFGITPTEQLDYNRWLADEAHARGLSVALKNDLDQIPDLLDWFDFAVNEECMAWEECGAMDPFVDAGKAVLHTEYVDDWADGPALNDTVCGANPGFSSIVKTWDLGPEFLVCAPG